MTRFLRDHCWDLLCASGVALITLGLWSFSPGAGMIFVGIAIFLLGAWAAYAHAKPPQRQRED